MVANRLFSKVLLFLITSAVIQWAFAERVHAQLPKIPAPTPAWVNSNVISKNTDAIEKSVVFINNSSNHLASSDYPYVAGSKIGKLEIDEIINDAGINISMTQLEKQISKELEQIEKTIDAKQEIAMAIQANKWAQACGQFTTKESLGGWGQAIMNAVTLEKTPFLIYGAKDFDKYCPLYGNLSVKNKQHVWVLVLTAMAFFESSCEPARSGVGPNGELMGLLQLHLDKEYQYSKGCRKGDSRTARGNITCGLSMLNDQLARGEPLFSPKSYWDVLIPQAKTKRALQIMTVLKHNGLCKN